MLAAGGDITMVTLTLALSLLLNNPHTLKKAKEELDINVGKGRLVNEADINNLFYLQAIIVTSPSLIPIDALLNIVLFEKETQQSFKALFQGIAPPRVPSASPSVEPFKSIE